MLHDRLVLKIVVAALVAAAFVSLEAGPVGLVPTVAGLVVGLAAMSKLGR